MRPAEHDLALIYLVKVVCVAELNVGDDIARKSLLARNNMAAAGGILFVAHADRFTVACFKIQLVGIFYLAYVLRQKGAAAFAVFVAYKETYRFHLLLSCLNIFQVILLCLERELIPEERLEFLRVLGDLVQILMYVYLDYFKAVISDGDIKAEILKLGHEAANVRYALFISSQLGTMPSISTPVSGWTGHGVNL